MYYALPAQQAWGEPEDQAAAMVVTTTEVHGRDLSIVGSIENKLARKKKKKYWRESFKLKHKDDKEQQKPYKNIKFLGKGKHIDKFRIM